MPSVLLIRHGQASYAEADYDVLSDTGRRQAVTVHRELASVLAASPVLLSGSLRRQRETAEPWCTRGSELSVDPRFNEYDAADVLAAHSPATASLERPVGADGEPIGSREFQTLLDAALAEWIERGADGPAQEPWPAFAERCRAALVDTMERLGRGEVAVVFTSGGVIGTLAAGLLGVPDRAMIAFNHVAVNGAVSKVVGGRRGLSLISFNEHLHLEPEGLITYR